MYNLVTVRAREIGTVEIGTRAEIGDFAFLRNVLCILYVEQSYQERGAFDPEINTEGSLKALLRLWLYQGSTEP